MKLKLVNTFLNIIKTPHFMKGLFLFIFSFPFVFIYFGDHSINLTKLIFIPELLIFISLFIYISFKIRKGKIIALSFMIMGLSVICMTISLYEKIVGGNLNFNNAWVYAWVTIFVLSAFPFLVLFGKGWYYGGKWIDVYTLFNKEQYPSENLKVIFISFFLLILQGLFLTMFGAGVIELFIKLNFLKNKNLEIIIAFLFTFALTYTFYFFSEKYILKRIKALK